MGLAEFLFVAVGGAFAAGVAWLTRSSDERSPAEDAVATRRFEEREKVQS